MEMIIRRTPMITRLSGVETRVWIGYDAEGIEYQLFVHRVSTSDPAGQAKLDCELSRQRPPDNAADVEAQLEQLRGVGTQQGTVVFDLSVLVPPMYFPCVSMPPGWPEVRMEAPSEDRYVHLLMVACGLTHAEARAMAAPLSPPEDEDVR